MTIKQESITSRQRKQIKRLFEDGAEWALDIVESELTQDGAQRLIGRGDELRAGFPELIRELARGRHAKEEVASSYTYPPEYKGPKLIREQVEGLLEFFPQLNATWALDNGQAWYDSLTSLPSWVEGPLVYVWWEAFGGYAVALDDVIKKIVEQRKFYDFLEGRIDKEYLRQHERTAKMERQLKASQPGDLLIVPNQAGLRWRGRSVRRGRELYEVEEFGLGSVAEGCRALTHPKRFVRWGQLHVDCAGDEYAPDSDGDFCRAPCFYFDDWRVRLRLGASRIGKSAGRFGASSGVLPQ